MAELSGGAQLLDHEPYLQFSGELERGAQPAVLVDIHLCDGVLGLGDGPAGCVYFRTFPGGKFLGGVAGRFFYAGGFGGRGAGGADSGCAEHPLWRHALDGNPRTGGGAGRGGFCAGDFGACRTADERSLYGSPFQARAWAGSAGLFLALHDVDRGAGDGGV